MPAGPEPITATRLPLLGWTSKGTGAATPRSACSRRTSSPWWRWLSRMAIASSTSSRRQCSSQGAGQTRPRMLGKGIVRLKMRAPSRQSPSVFALRKPGISMWLGHLFWQGGRQ